MSKMTRIQRRRTKGWRMPENAIYVGRPTRWGNYLRADMLDLNDRPLGRALVVELDRLATLRFVEEADAEEVEAFLAPLRGHDLACWCPLDQPCHADVLLELVR